jgi:Mrp family chromosome partitioning ATPase/capsular polysaccharide biosynthesis protein
MDLLSYFRVLRRRWVLILILAVVGGALGYATTLFKNEKAKERTFYKATSTLQLDTTNTTTYDQQFSNVDQVAILATTGTVPDAVAKELGTTESGQQLAERIITVTNSTPSTVDITAIDPDAERAKDLSDTFTAQLIKSIDARVLAKYTKAQTDLNNQVASLKAQADELLGRMRAVPPPPDLDTIQRQYDATQNQYYSTYGSLQSLITTGPPQSRLSELQSAQPVPIGQTEYESRLSLGVSGQNHLSVQSSASATPAIEVSAGSGPALDDPLSRTLLGVFLGLLVGIGLALVLDRLDHKLRTRNDAETAYGVPVLAEVPKFTRAQQKDRNVVAVAAPLSRAAEAYRAIRTSLLFQQASVAGAGTEPQLTNGNGNGRAPSPGDPDDIMADSLFEPQQQDRLVIMVTSASPREGKTNTSANLAAVFAEAGASVLIVNCDFRRPSIHRLLNVEDIPRTVQDTSIPGVKVVTNVLNDPNANPAQVVSAQRQVIAAARQRFDVIILDTAPVLTANDAIEVVGAADLLLLIARAEVTTTDKAERTMDVLTRLEAPIGGIVLVASNEVTNDYYYYYQRNRVTSSRKRSKKPYTPTTAPGSSAPSS